MGEISVSKVVRRRSLVEEAMVEGVASGGGDGGGGGDWGGWVGRAVKQKTH